MGDRHAREYKPSKHHAVLLVNTAMTFCNFVFDTFEYQRSRAAKSEASSLRHQLTPQVVLPEVIGTEAVCGSNPRH